MCGIAGVVVGNSTLRFLSAAQQMTTALLHRGPDSHSVQDLGRCLLANTRLAIVDLSYRGRQPMTNEDSTVWITYNGECYNAAELRPTLLPTAINFAPAPTRKSSSISMRSRRGMRQASSRHVCIRHLGLARSKTPPRARPPRNQAALLLGRRGSISFCLRDKGHARLGVAAAEARPGRGREHFSSLAISLPPGPRFKA